LADKITSLSPELLAELKALVLERRSRNPSNRPVIQPEDLEQASDTYVVMTPEDGIPATADDDVGHADCEVHYLDDNGTTAELVPTGQILRVYNLSETDVGADSLVLVTKTKQGSWFVTGDRPLPSCTLAKLKATDCLQATVTGDGASVFMEGDGAGHWNSLTDLNYGYGAGPLEFWFENGLPHLKLDDLELMYCGNSCWSGGELTGHLTNTGTGIPDCQGAYFVVCLECAPCVIPAVTTPCCPGVGVTIPGTLYVTVSGSGTGDGGPYALTYNGTLWSGTIPTFGSCSDVLATLFCLPVSHVWVISLASLDYTTTGFDCSIPVWYGTQSGGNPATCGVTAGHTVVVSGSATFGVGPTVCCPADTLPDSLNVTITSGGTCNGTYAITRVPGSQRWRSTGVTIGSCNPATAAYQIQFECVGADWKLRIGGADLTFSSANCATPSVVFTSALGTACGCSSPFTATVTV
jgi:hypothetical protein